MVPVQPECFNRTPHPKTSCLLQQDDRDIHIAEAAVNVVIAVGKKTDASVIQFQILTK
jgi:hypothetical protein